jgi:hypothetical protein
VVQVCDAVGAYQFLICYLVSSCARISTETIFVLATKDALAEVTCAAAFTTTYLQVSRADEEARYTVLSSGAMIQF